MKSHPTPSTLGLIAAATVTLLFNVPARAADVEYPGYLKVENFDNINGDAVAALLAAPKYTNNTPDSVTYITSLYWARNPAADNYGSRITGFITPAETADYVFFIASDNDSSFYLSTDATPANLKLIAADRGWQNARTWTGVGGTTSGDGTTNVVYRRGYNPGPDVLATNGFVWVGPFQNRSDEFLHSPATNLLGSGAQAAWPTLDANGNPVIHLVASQKYYFQYLFKEGGGGDNSGVAWKKATDPDPNNGDPEIQADLLSTMAPDTLTFINEPEDVTVGEGQIANFSVDVLGVPGDSEVDFYTYQWYRNNVSILDGTGNAKLYSILSPTLADNGSKYHVEVTSYGSSPAGILYATSMVATLSVIVDTSPPSISKVVSSESFASVKISFSEAVQDSAVDPANYVFNNGLTAFDANFDVVADNGSGGADNTKSPLNPLNRLAVVVLTSPQTSGATYSLTINNVKDLVGKNLTPATATMYANVFRPGILAYKRWFGAPGGAAINNVANLTGNQVAYENPQVLGTLPLAETAVPDGTAPTGSYVSRASGYFIPKVTTNYVFLFCADNNGFMYLSTDADPANRKLIAADVGWQNARTWTGPGGDTAKRRGDLVGGGPFENRSDEFLTSARAASGGGLPGGPVIADGLDPEPWPTTDVNSNAVITLTAGNRYYMELWHEEFEGGRVEATMKIAGTPDPANGTVSTIDSTLIGGLVDPSSVPPALSLSSGAGGTTVTYTGTLLSSDTANGTYTPVTGATSPYTVPAITVGNKYYKSRFP